MFVVVREFCARPLAWLPLSWIVRVIWPFCGLNWKAVILGAVVSIRDAGAAAKLRAIMPQSILLVPGYGAQGLTAADVAPLFKSDGSGAAVVAGRSVIYAYEQPKYMELYTSEWDKCVEHACKDFIADLQNVVRIG